MQALVVAALSFAPSRSYGATRVAPSRARVEADLGQTVRKLIYGSFAVVGGLGAISAGNEVVAAISAGDTPEIVNGVKNFAIDAVVFGTSAAGWNIDQTSAKGAARPAPPPASAPAIAAPRLDAIRDLEVRLRLPDLAANDVAEQQVKVEVLQRDARQTLVIIVGTEAVVEDLLLSAIMSKSAFASANLLLVPVAFEVNDVQSDALKAVAAAKGFAKPTKPKGSTVTFVAPPVEQMAWSRALSAEVAVARAQGARTTPSYDPLDKGILLVVGAEQLVLQRRLGRPPQWSTFIEEISAAGITTKGGDATN